MKSNKFIIGAWSALVATIAIHTSSQAGNERGGGAPPAPIIMSEDASYECAVALTQLNKQLQRAVTSRGSVVLDLVKGSEASAGSQLSQMSNLKHYQLQAAMGPRRPTELEVSPAPKGATFEDRIVLEGQYSKHGLNIQLRVIAASGDVSSQAFDLAALDAKEPLKTKVIQRKQSSTGSDDRVLDVTCTRIK